MILFRIMVRCTLLWAVPEPVEPEVPETVWVWAPALTSPTGAETAALAR